MRARYKVGLSGTLVRKDGKHVVLPDYFGAARFLGAVENTMTPVVHVYKSSIELNANEFIPWSLKINALMENSAYRQQIADLLRVYIDLGHKVLVVADRTEFLEALHLAFSEDSFIITGKIKGMEVRNSIMEAVSKMPKGCALFATQSIFSEGVSLNELSCLMLATPVNNEPLLKQLIGRIIRYANNKPQPVVIDINLSGTTGKNHGNERKKSYIKWGLEIRFP
jgi:superfamily II DNA or RNA helicase